jgi:hypothetical protein
MEQDASNPQYIMNLNLRLRNALNRTINKIFEKAKNSTIQLFHNDKPEWKFSSPELIGTGVLVEFNNGYFIITAAHVVQGYALKKTRNPYKTEDDYDDKSEAYLSLDNIGFIYNNCYYPTQRVTFTNTRDGQVENNVDIAVITLDDQSAQELKKKYKFMSSRDITLDHHTTAEQRYYIYGYPADWCNLNISQRAISTDPFKFVTKGISIQESSNAEYDERFNMLLSYDRSKIVDSAKGNCLKDFNPKGISGCGLWYYDQSNMLSLIGIMVEDKSIKDNQPFMMATRIDEAIKIIKHLQSI